MALSHNPKIVTDGLALYLDAANSKSYNGAENLMDASENLQIWGASNCTYLANVTTAPDGTKTATAVMATAADVNHYIIRAAAGTTVSNTIYTFSIYVKKKGTLFSNLMFQPLFKDGTYSYIANWNLTAKTATTVGTGITSSIEELDDGWFRVTSTFNSTTGANPIQPLIYIGNYGNILGDGTSGFYMWGAQLELGSYATKYTKTTTAAIVRSTTWNDLINNNTVNITGSTYSINQLGNITMDNGDESLSFNNSDSLYSAFYNNSFTLITWIKSKNITYPQSRHPLWIENNGPSASIKGLSMGEGASGTGMTFEISDGTTYITQTINHTVTENTTYCRAIVFNKGSTLDYYVNGAFIGSVIVSTITGSIYSSGGMLFGNVAGWRFIGEIYSFLLYNRALNSSEVKQNFNALRGRYGV